MCRCVGWLIRFIHNRNLATENIVTACSRSAALGQVPAQVIASLVKRVEVSGANFPDRSLLNAASKVVESKGPGAGMFCIAVKRTRRNSRNTIPTARLLEEFSRSTGQLGLRQTARNIISSYALTAGVRINNREWKTDAHAAFMGHQGSVCVGTVVQFFVINHKEPNDRNPSQMVLVSLNEQELKEQKDGMFIIKETDVSANLVIYINADQITHKLKRLPHPDKVPGLWVGLPVFASI